MVMVDGAVFLFHLHQQENSKRTKMSFLCDFIILQVFLTHTMYKLRYKHVILLKKNES